MNRAKSLLVVAIATAIVAFFAFDLDRFASFESVGASRDWLVGHYERSPFLVIVAFFATYVISAALSIPVAAVMTLLAGAIFGVVLRHFQRPICDNR